MAKDPICLMTVDEKIALKLTSKGENYFFCSAHCLKKFVKANKIPQQDVASCIAGPKAPVYKNKTFIVGAILVALVLLSYVILLLEAFRDSLFVYFKTIWWAIILGFILGGVIDHFVPREYISHILAKPKKRTIFYSVILGFFMSACSHGILALSIELHKKGASNSAVVSFLLASPWANLTITIMLIGFFGLKALFIIISAIMIAIITGLIFQILEKKNLIETNDNIVDIEEDFSIIDDIKRRFSAYKLSAQSIKSDIRGIIANKIF